GTVPRGVGLALLPEGAVQVAWGVVASQFPPLVYAGSDVEFRRKYPGLKLTLPLDDVLRQVPPGTFSVGPASNHIDGLDAFPPPFQPLEMPRDAPDASTATPTAAPAPAATVTASTAAAPRPRTTPRHPVAAPRAAAGPPRPPPAPVAAPPPPPPAVPAPPPPPVAAPPPPPPPPRRPAPAPAPPSSVAASRRAPAASRDVSPEITSRDALTR